MTCKTVHDISHTGSGMESCVGFAAFWRKKENASQMQEN